MMEFPGLAPTPEMLSRIRAAKEAEGIEEEEEGEPGLVMRDEAYNGEGTPPLAHRVRHLLRSIHWKHQKEVLKYVEAAVASDRQWVVIRKFIMDIQAAQEREMTLHVGRMIMQEVMVEENDGRSRTGNERGDGRGAPEPTLGASRGVLTAE